MYFWVGPTMTPTVHGDVTGATLAAPTHLNASDSDYSTKVGLSWETIRGATSYRIFRNTTNTPGSADDVGTTAANYFFDATAVAGQAYFYWVRAENSTTSSSMSVVDQGTRAVGTLLPGEFSPLDPPVAPAGNTMTATKAYLGKTLFWDEQMSSTKTVACGTCHRPAEGGGDPRTAIGDARSTNPGADGVFGTPDDVFGSPGVPQNNLNGTYTLNASYGYNEQVTGRKAPSYLNSGYSTTGLFWDGRALNTFRDPLTNSIILNSGASLESQASGPPVSPGEMGHTGRDWSQVAARIAASRPLALATNVPTGLRTWINGRTYPQLFEEAFGTPDVTPSRIAMAIATHERVLFSDRTPLDKELMGIPSLTSQEVAGRDVFNASNCAGCHRGPLITNHTFENIGVRPQTEDVGRFGVTGNSGDLGRFKTPTLRNVELHAPYMHNGELATLEDVVGFYNRGGDFDAPNINHGFIRPLDLSAQQRSDLVAFLKRPLTDPRVAAELTPFDRPHLYTESSRVPQITGTGRPGSGGLVPLAKAIEPPVVGNPSFAVAVSRSVGGASAVLVIDSTDPGVGASVPAAGSFAYVPVSLAGSGSGNGYYCVSLAIPNDPALIGQTFYGRWYVTDAAATNGFSVSQLIQFTIFGDSPAVHAPFDFDGDGKTDLSIFRPGPGEWWYLKSSNGGNAAAQFGAGTDKVTPGDFTGDGKTDIAFFRPSTGFWYVLRSDDFSFYSFPFGTSTDVPAPADYDADGKTDAAVFRPSSFTWFISNSGGGTTIQQFGAVGDVPVAADYDGDAKADIAIYRPSLGQWWIQRSTQGTIAFQFGTSTDRTVVGDYTGDGKADVGFWRPSTGEWFILRSEDQSYYSFPFGISTDVPTPGDYDGDGKTDAGVFRPSSSTWFVSKSGGGTLIQSFGQAGDVPVPNAFVR